MNEISITDAVKILRSKNTNIAFIDLRKREKYVQGFAFGSINCEIEKFNQHLVDLVPDNKTTILLIGIENDANKKKIFKVLNKFNFKSYFTIKEDYKAWVKNKLPFWKGEYTFSKAFGEWVEKSSYIQNIFPDELKKMHKKNNFLQIDSRPKIEFEKFSLPFSHHCSGGELPIFLNNNVNINKTYIVHCAGRTRSIIAYQTLKDFNFENKKFVLNGGTQNWVLSGYDRVYNNKSQLKKTKINLDKDLNLSKEISKKFKIPKTTKSIHDQNNYFFQINSEIKNFENIKGWRNLNATTLIQNTDKFIASTLSKIFVYSFIPSSSLFSVIWLRRMGYNAIWQVKKPRSFNRRYQPTKIEPTYFFPKRHLGNKNHSRGYLNWEHSLIPTINKWGCRYPWISANSFNLKNTEHIIYKVYRNF
jgi:rhodanese-related sulfurtransferase